MELIKTKDYLLYVDEEAKIKCGNYYFEATSETQINIANKELDKVHYRQLILLYYPLTSEAKELDLPLLPYPFKEEVDIDQLAHDHVKKDMGSFYNAEGFDTFRNVEFFIDGYKAAQPKQFSLEDIKEALRLCCKELQQEHIKGFTTFICSQKEIIQSLSAQQLPKEFIPSYTKECDCYNEFCHSTMLSDNRHCKDGGIPKILTITNSKGRQEVVGEYK